MKNNDYLVPGIVAILLAFLFPLSWWSVAGVSDTSLENFYHDTEFGLSSGLFLMVGLASLFVYYSLMKLLHDHFNYRKADFVLITMMVVLVIFYLGNFLLSAFSLSMGLETSNQLVAWLFMASLVTFGIIDIVLGIVLIIAKEKLSGRVQAFAILNLIMGICELSIVLSPVVLLLFPLVCLILAFNFLAQPEEIELV